MGQSIGAARVGRPCAFERCYFWVLSPLFCPGPPPVPFPASLGSGAGVVWVVSVDEPVADVSGAGSSAKARVALANERPAQRSVKERVCVSCSPPLWTGNSGARRSTVLGPPAPSPPPAVVVEIAEPIEAALQFFRSAALCLRNALPWHIPAPLEMPSRIVVPGWPL